MDSAQLLVHIDPAEKLLKAADADPRSEWALGPIERSCTVSTDREMMFTNV